MHLFTSEMSARVCFGSITGFSCNGLMLLSEIFIISSVTLFTEIFFPAPILNAFPKDSVFFVDLGVCEPEFGKKYRRFKLYRVHGYEGILMTQEDVDKIFTPKDDK